MNDFFEFIEKPYSAIRISGRGQSVQQNMA